MDIKSVFRREYKPSGLDYFEMALMVVCLLMHHLSWASITADGRQILQFVPFDLFGTNFTIAIYVMFIVTIAMKFVGRFSGLSLLIVSYLGSLVYEAHTAFNGTKELLNQMQSAVGLGDGLSGMFGSFAGSTTSRSGLVEHSLTIDNLYMIVGVLVGALALCVLISWIISICRLCSEHRHKLTSGYYIDMVGYVLIGVCCFIVLKMLGVSEPESLNEVITASKSGIIGILCMATLVTGLTMFLVNTVVVGVIELLRERPEKRMVLWCLALALAFLLLFIGSILFLSLTARYMSDQLKELLEDSFASILSFLAHLIIELIFVVAFVTCLLRAIYYGFYYKKEEAQNSNNEEILMEVTDTSSETDVGLTKTYNQNSVETDDKENPNKKWYYVGGGVLAVLLLVLLSLFLFKGCNTSDNLLNIQKPSWEKFVMVTSDNVTLYKEPNENSSKLMFAMENIDSDMCGMEYRWEDQGKKRGYKVDDFSPELNAVLPVVDENGEWYKVQVFPEYAGQHTEAYINKKRCKEVTPQPITNDVLERIDKATYRCDYVVNSGRLKGICFSSSLQEFDEECFGMSQLMEGVLYYPESVGVLINREGSSGMSFKKSEVNADGYTLIYGDDRSFKIDGYPMVFDTRTMTETEIEEIYNSIKVSSPMSFEAQYYFPDANEDRLFSFTYSIGSSNAMVNNENDQPEEGVKNYVISGATDDNPQQELMVEVDEEIVSTGIFETYITVMEEFDDDGDGYHEALICETCGGSGCPEKVSFVYYDKNSKCFKQTDYFEYYSQPVKEEWNGKLSYVQRYGLHMDRYVFEDHQLRRVENETKDVGASLKRWTCESMFDKEADEEKTVHFDMDGDGIEETLTLSHFTSNLYDGGESMSFDKITWGSGRESECSGMYTGKSLTILESMTNGMHDVLIGDAYFYRWNGERYKEWGWDGENLVKSE